VIAPDQPLAGRDLWARHVYRRYGRLWLVVEPGDGGVASVEVRDTDVLAAAPVAAAPAGELTLSSEGARRLIVLLDASLRRIAGAAGGAGEVPAPSPADVAGGSR